MENRADTTSLPEFSVGSVFNRSFSALFGNLGVFIGITLVAWVPSTLLELASLFTERNTGSSILELILNIVIQGASSYAILQILTGKNVSVSDALSNGSKRFGTLVLVGILTTLGIIAGLILLIVPGLMLACMWAIAVPACVVERLGAIEGLKRSVELTKGYRWRVLGLSLIFYISVFAIAGVFSFAATLIFENEMFTTLVTNIAMILPLAFGNVMFAVMYYDLRAVKEGVSVDSLANVFD